MLKFLFAIVIACCVPFCANCQNLTLTAEKNDAWLKELKKASLSEQLVSIKSRLLTDTNIYAVSHSDRLILKSKEDEHKKEVECRILLLVNTGKNLIRIKIGNSTPNYKIVQLCKLLDENNVKEVVIYNHDMSVGMFGSDGSWGAISLVQKNKSFLKKIKDLMG